MITVDFYFLFSRILTYKPVANKFSVLEGNSEYSKNVEAKIHLYFKFAVSKRSTCYLRDYDSIHRTIIAETYVLVQRFRSYIVLNVPSPGRKQVSLSSVVKSIR